jgi:hypothetical protein
VILFVGQAPSRPKEPKSPEIPGTEAPAAVEPLAGNSGHRLAAILGIPFPRFLLATRLNLNCRYPGKKGRGDGFDLLEGARRAEEISALLREDDLVVLLGVQVARCFGLKYTPLEVGRLPSNARYLMFPHPSGINRYWNNPLNRDVAKTAFYVASGLPPDTL